MEGIDYQFEGFRAILERSRRFRRLSSAASKVVLLKFLAESCFSSESDFAALPQIIDEYAETKDESEYLLLLARIGRSFGREDYEEHSLALNEFLAKFADDYLVTLVKVYFEYQQ